MQEETNKGLVEKIRDQDNKIEELPWFDMICPFQEKSQKS